MCKKEGAIGGILPSHPSPAFAHSPLPPTTMAETLRMAPLASGLPLPPTGPNHVSGYHWEPLTSMLSRRPRYHWKEASPSPPAWQVATPLHARCWKGGEVWSGNSRSILIASVEHQEGVGLPKEIFLVQLVGTELHCGYILVGRRQNKGVRQEKAGGYPNPRGNTAPRPWKTEGFRAPSWLKDSMFCLPCTNEGPGPGLILGGSHSIFKQPHWAGLMEQCRVGGRGRG